MKICYFILFVALCNYAHVIAQSKLGTYKILKDSITISGLSSGAAMAVQMHVAFSSTFSGVGIVTGPPYYCAGTGGSNNALTTCMYLSGSTIDVNSLASTLSDYVSKGVADDASNMRNDKVYIYHGTVDYTVTEGVVKRNEDFYKKYIPAANFKTLYTTASTHGFITNNFGLGCNVLNSQNYINNCNYNQAYAILKQMYNLQTAEPDKTAAYSNSLIEFDQTEFFPPGTSGTISMDTIGYAYVPRACSERTVCRLHIALHGCTQGKYQIGNVFPDKTGYNQVADANNIIVIYPQAKAISGTNPNGCWDWWGYINADYANKNGPQMKALKSMIDRITAGGLIDENATTTTTTAGSVSITTTTPSGSGSITTAPGCYTPPVTTTTPACYRG